MSVHLDQYRQSPSYKWEEEPKLIYYEFTTHYQRYAASETVRKQTLQDIDNMSKGIYPNATPFDYGEPPLFTEGSQETISRSSQKMQKLFKELVDFHQKYKGCIYERCVFNSFPMERFLRARNVRNQRQQLESSFAKIEERVRPLVLSKEQGFQYLLEKICHIGTEMICSIGQDSEKFKRLCEDFETMSSKYKSRERSNGIKSEHAQLVARIAKLKELAKVLGRREFDLGSGRKCFFPQESIEKIEWNLKTSPLPGAWVLQSLSAAASGVGDFFSRKAEQRQEARKQARIKEHEAWQKECEMMYRVPPSTGRVSTFQPNFNQWPSYPSSSIKLGMALQVSGTNVQVVNTWKRC